MEDYIDQLTMVETVKADLARNEVDVFNRHINGELSRDQLSLYRREHYMRTQLLRVMHDQLGDILISESYNHPQEP
jgi:U3 small nucleolar ribonucleoprotein component